MVQVPNTLALFDQGANVILRCEVFKTDGDTSDSNRADNRYIYNGTELKLIAAVWDKKFVGFEPSPQKSRG